MKKVALVFVLAVLVPSLLLAWLAVRSLRDQQFLLERQQSLLDQHATDTLAQNISGYLAQRQQEFSAQVENMAAAEDAQTLAAHFDDQLRPHWPLADVGFCVTAAGKILSPQPNARPAAQMFRLDNSGFLGNREPVEVYLTANNANVNAGYNSGALNNGWNNSPLTSSRSPVNSYANNSATPILQEQRQEAKPDEQSQVPKPSGQSQAFAINGAGSGGGGGGGGGYDSAAKNLKTRPPAPSGTASNLVQTDLTVLEPQPKHESPPVPELNGPATAANAAYPQAEGFADAISKNSSHTQAVSSPNGRNGFYIPSAVKAPQTQQAWSKAAGQANVPSSSISSRSPQFGGIAGSDTRSANHSNNSTPVVSETVVVPQATDSIRSELATTKDAIPPSPATNMPPQQTVAFNDSPVEKDLPSQSALQSTLNYKAAQSRKVNPQSQKFLAPEKAVAQNGTDELQDNLSKVVPAEAEFRQLIGDQTDGMLARFLQNKLKLMCWHRLSSQPDLIFGAQLNLDRVVDGLRSMVQADHSFGDEICLAVLDDNAKPVVLSRDGFQANWKRPFVATEVGDALPHWEVAAYLINPAQLSQAAQTAKLTLGLLIAVLVVAIGIGSLLIVRGLEAELKLARQKTDFVSNVSHELKTPLTSIRMFSELLAEGRVADQAKQHSYLQIITAEAGRLTRLINNVLDFSRMEQGEKKYNFQPCNLSDIVRSAAETFRPHLEASGFQFGCELPAAQIPLRGDPDALSQIIVNLLSNAEKYSGQSERRSPTRHDSGSETKDGPGQETGSPLKEISLQLLQKQSPLPHAEVWVLDRGPGVPRGSEEKIFEKFYRAHDSLSSGIQGSGLGLTIARQIARAHGGDVVYEPRSGGGSCFVLRLPVQTS